MKSEIKELLKSNGFVNTNCDNWFYIDESKTVMLCKSLFNPMYYVDIKVLGEKDHFVVCDMTKSTILEVLSYTNALEKRLKTHKRVEK